MSVLFTFLVEERKNRKRNVLFSKTRKAVIKHLPFRLRR